MKILEQDLKTLQSQYPEAAIFIIGAELRREYWDLCAKHSPSQKDGWSHTKQKRLEELRNHPACMEPWFVLQVGRAFGEWPDGSTNG